MATAEQVKALADFARTRAPNKIKMCPKCYKVRVDAAEEGRLDGAKWKYAPLDLYGEGGAFCGECRVAYVSYAKE